VSRCDDPTQSWKEGRIRGRMGEAGRLAYIAGPMRGYESYNFPAFFAAEAALLAADFGTINPARIDENCPVQDITDMTAADRQDVLDQYVERDLAAIRSLRPGHDVVVVLDGWAASRGASAEVAVANWRNVEVWDLATALERGGKVAA
jgi:hypothetical protein